jgi:EAL domain-containing protein (putative c-di-GMP-specific phosphodiesterase class I)/GGDEF domain-containing protein
VTDKIKNKPSKISVSIYENFYFNKNLSLPTVIKEYEKIEEQLLKARYLACITVKFDDIAKIEHLYGSNVYIDILTRVTQKLRDIKKRELRGKDVFVLDLYDIDTFVIFLSSPREKTTQLLYHLEKIAERIRTNLESEVFNLLYPYLKAYSRATIGYALELLNPMVSNMRLITQLIHNAKKMGEFCVVKRHFMSRYSLQKIIVEKSVKTYFQPIVDLNSLKIIGYEALSRGPEETEFFNPLLLFLVASECGLSFELDRLCRHKALESSRRLKTNKKIFINTLSMTIHDTEFRGIYLKELLKDLKLKPENVVFEISEKLAIDNYSLFRKSLKDYTDLGIVHAGDDFGTGHSGLERIMELHPGYLKIDMSFTRDIDSSFMKQEIVRALVSLAESIGSEVVAEGIETKKEYEKLKELNVKLGQGFLFGAPSKKLTNIRRDI